MNVRFSSDVTAAGVLLAVGCFVSPCRADRTEDENAGRRGGSEVAPARTRNTLQVEVGASGGVASASGASGALAPGPLVEGFFLFRPSALGVGAIVNYAW